MVAGYEDEAPLKFALFFGSRFVKRDNFIG